MKWLGNVRHCLQLACMASIAITISTPQGSRVLAFADESAAASTAEAILRGLPVTALPAPVWIECNDPAVRRRLTDYLVGIQAELVGR
jgi:hypothetical protein